VQEGKVIYARGYGRASLEYAAPITPQTIFHVASISKQFTAFAIALLADEGALSLDDDVRSHLPDVPDFDSPITLRHLVHHTSGLRDQWELLTLAGWRWDDVITTADILDLVSHQRELNFRPGDEYAYCNTGYTLLAEVIARASGLSFRAFCAERIFKPLGMQSTHFHDDHTEIVPNRAYSYDPHEGGYRHAVLSYATAGATSLFTTVEDLARWSVNLLDGAVGGPAVLMQIQERGVLNDGTLLPYAFGLMISDRHGQRIIEHAGGDAGFRAHFLLYPDRQLAVIVLANIGNFDPVGTAHAIADRFLEQAAPAPAVEEEPAETVDSEMLKKYTGMFYSATTGQTRIIELRDTGLSLGPGPGHTLRLAEEGVLQIVRIPHIRLRMLIQAESELPRLSEEIGLLPPIIYSAVTPASYTSEQLASFAGTYHSEELGIAYTITIEEGKLTVRRRKHSPTTFEPASADVFTGIVGLRFTRDGAGAIDGFLVSTGRVRNIRFARR
jgi:CubicO group peptidase (beta-lactamase class C family)